MAIRKIPSGSFQVYWNNPFTGKRESVCRPTEAEAKKHDALIKWKLLYERESFRPAETEDPRKPDSLEEVFKAYLAEKIHTRKGVSWQLDCMKSALILFHDTPVRDISSQSLAEIVQAERRKGVKNATVHDRLRVIKTLLRWAVKRGYADRVPAFPELPPRHYEKFVPPSQSEIIAMLEVAPDHIRRVIILGSQIGMRVGPSEMFRLTWADIDLVRRVVRVPAARKNPGEPWREVPIREELMPIFEAWRAADEKSGMLHVIHYKGSPVSRIKRAWDSTLKSAGITRRIRPYDLRHAFATEMIAAGVDIGTTASLMGHTSPVMILKYYQHVMNAQKKAAVEALPHVHASMCMASGMVQ